MSKPNTVTLEEGSKEWHRLRERCKTDLYFLVAKVLGMEEHVPMTLRAHYALCRFAERRTGIPAIDNSRVQLIQVARGWGKSVCVTMGRTIQRILIDPNWAAGIANERQMNAEAFLGTVKSQFETNDFLRALFPEYAVNNPRTDTVLWSSSRIVTPARTKPNPVNPSVMAAGIDATVTGVHMNEWIIDDLLSEKAAENARSGSYSEIEQLNRRVIELQPLLTRPKQDPLTFVCTPWWPGDTYDYVEDLFGRGEEPVEYIWNIRLPDGEVQSISLIQKGEIAVFRLKPIVNGVHIYPEKFDEDTLEKLQQDDPVFFAAQFLLKPTAGGVASFKPEYLREFQWEMNGKQLRFRTDDGKIQFRRVNELQVIMAVDPAISEKSAAARSAVTVVGSDGDHLFLLDVWAERASPHDVAMKIIEFARTYRPQRVIIEAVAYQMALAQILTLLCEKHHMPQLPIYEHRTGSQVKKNVRIAGLEPYFRRGFFHYHPKSQTPFLEEYLEFSPEIGSRKVDILDSLSFMKEHWETLGFLDGQDNRRPTVDSFRKANEAAIARIKAHNSRQRGVLHEWRG